MSRGFVRESDQQAASDTVPERVVSSNPNLVTPTGLRLIESRIRELETERRAALAKDDTAALASISRDMRYWMQRKATARVIETPPNPDVVRFGVRVELQFEDGSTRTYRLVGEDEADPARGLLSWASPLAELLIGRAPGDTVEVAGRAAEIVRLGS